MKKIEVVIFDEELKRRLTMSLSLRKDLQIDDEKFRFNEVRRIVSADIVGKNACVSWKHNGNSEGFMVYKP